MADFVCFVELMQTGDLFEYVIPRFPPLKPLIREVKFKWKNTEDGAVYMFDGFARECDDLHQH